MVFRTGSALMLAARRSGGVPSSVQRKQQAACAVSLPASGAAHPSTHRGLHGTPYSDLTVGVPKETHPGEKRVSLVPASVALLKKAGVKQIKVESGAGAAASFTDEAYASAGATIVAKARHSRANCRRTNFDLTRRCCRRARFVAQAADAFAADFIAKVRAPSGAESALLRPASGLCSFVAPAQNKELMAKLAEQKGAREQQRGEAAPKSLFRSLGSSSLPLTLLSLSLALSLSLFTLLRRSDGVRDGRGAAHAVPQPGVRRAVQPGQRGRLPRGGGGGAPLWPDGACPPLVAANKP